MHVSKDLSGLRALTEAKVALCGRASDTWRRREFGHRGPKAVVLSNVVAYFIEDATMAKDSCSVPCPVNIETIH